MEFSNESSQMKMHMTHRTTKDISEIPKLNQTKPVGAQVRWFDFKFCALPQRSVSKTIFCAFGDELFA